MFISLYSRSFLNVIYLSHWHCFLQTGLIVELADVLNMNLGDKDVIEQENITCKDGVEGMQSAVLY